MNRKRHYALLAGILALGLTLGFDSDAAQPVVSECDRLAAHPWDPHKVGKGVYWNKIFAARAVLACERAVNGDPNPRNMFQYGRALAKAKQYEQAAYWYGKAADEGYVQAQFALGDIYEFGEGVDKDYKAAEAWYRKAAALGDMHAENRLGRMRRNTFEHVETRTESAIDGEGRRGGTDHVRRAG